MLFAPFDSDIEKMIFSMLARKKKLDQHEIEDSLGEGNQSEIKKALAHLEGLDLVDELETSSQTKRYVLTRNGIALSREMLSSKAF